jgi:hypothetical protein
MSRALIIALSLSVLAMLVTCEVADDNSNRHELSSSDETNLELALANQVRRGLLAQILLKQRLEAVAATEASSDDTESSDEGQLEKRASKYRTGNTRNKVSQLHSSGHFDGANYRKVLAEKNQMYQNLLG